MKTLNIKGSTLIECIAAFSLFSIATLILLSGFLTAGNLVVKSGDIKDVTNKITYSIETDDSDPNVTVDEGPINSFTFTLGNVTYTSKGSYKTGTYDDYKLAVFIPDVTTGSLIIPGTGIPVNGHWPTADEFPEYWSTVYVPYGTTFEYDGEYYIVSGLLLFVFPQGATPTDGWWYNNNAGITQITDRPVITWNGGTQQEFRELIDYRINKGDKVLWDGNYYVYNGYSYEWPLPPDMNMWEWTMIQ